MSANQFIVAIMLVLIGFSTYYVIPMAFIKQEQIENLIKRLQGETPHGENQLRIQVGQIKQNLDVTIFVEVDSNSCL